MTGKRRLFEQTVKFILGVACLAAILILPFIALRGVVWAFDHVGEWLLGLTSKLTDICVFVLFPLCIFKTTRSLGGIGFVLSSYVFGTALYGLSCVIVFNVWGYTGLLLSLLTLVGVVPIAFLAALTHPTSVTFWPLPVGLAFTFGTRWFGGYLLASKRELHAPVQQTKQPASVSLNHIPLKKTVPEQEAAAIYVVSRFRDTQRAWPTVYSNLKESREDKFVVVDESTAAFDLGLAAVAQDLQAVKNLFPAEQASRIDRWTSAWVLNCAETKDLGRYALNEVKEYEAMFQNESKLGADHALGAIPGRLLHRWLGAGISNFAVNLKLIDIMLISQTTMELTAFGGFWKTFKDKFDLVDKAPIYTLTKRKVLEHMERTEQIMTDTSLTDDQRAGAIQALLQEYQRS